tara:strand:+ start:1059 stop:2594 length:1536 start_codon:yes stop_codon:yes gene_type:complete
MNNPRNYTGHVRELVNGGQINELLNTYEVTKLPLLYPTPPIVKSEPSTLEVMELVKTKSNNRKFGRQFAGQTPDWSQKNPTEERDVESWGEARQRKNENREWGLPEENDLSDPAASDPNVAKPSRMQLEEELYKPEVNYKGIIQDKIKPKDKPKAQKQMTYAELVAHRKAHPEEYPEIALEYLEKEGTGGHGVGDGAGAQVANGGAGLASGGTAHVSTSAGIFTATHGGDRGKKIKRPNDSSHTVNLDNFNKRGTQISALTAFVERNGGNEVVGMMKERFGRQFSRGKRARKKHQRDLGQKEMYEGTAGRRLRPGDPVRPRKRSPYPYPAVDPKVKDAVRRMRRSGIQSDIHAKRLETLKNRPPKFNPNIFPETPGVDEPSKPRKGEGWKLNRGPRGRKKKLPREQQNSPQGSRTGTTGARGRKARVGGRPTPEPSDFGRRDVYRKKRGPAGDRATIRKPETNLTKAKAPYYNRDVQGLNTSTIRDQKSQKKQSKQDNMAGHKRNSIWRNP